MIEKIECHKGQLAALAFGLVLLIFGVINQMSNLEAGADIGVEIVPGVKDWILILSNSALVPGVLLTGLGVIVRISEEGFFDGIKYSMSTIFTHVRGSQKRYDSFYDYTKREKKKSGGNPLFLPGVFYLTVAVILTAVFYLI